MTREVIFSQIQRPSKFRDKIVYVFENFIDFIIGLRYGQLGGACHTYKKLADVKIGETFDSIIHGKVFSLLIWECVDCHMRELWICVEDKWADVKND